ncbi:hypothetical protein L195_g061717, partial [Trifolium pratense]
WRDEKAVKLKKICNKSFPLYHDDLSSWHDNPEEIFHRGHDEAKIHAIVATMGAMDAQESPKPS